MKMLIIARHGDATLGDDGGLTSEGLQQAERLAGALREYVWGPTVVLSSTSRRGRETTGVLTKALGVPAIFDEMLWKDIRHPGGSFEEIAKLVERHTQAVETSIIVGHQGHGEMLADHMVKVYSRSIDVPFIDDGLAYGGACIVNFMEASCTVIP